MRYDQTGGDGGSAKGGAVAQDDANAVTAAINGWELTVIAIRGDGQAWPLEGRVLARASRLPYRVSFSITTLAGGLIGIIDIPLDEREEDMLIHLTIPAVALVSRMSRTVMVNLTVGGEPLVA